ncbi:MAG TPA: hypothetical protein VLT35_05190 [Methanocella sp.]|nr:hypothetical protein [Methanocella sp.]
MQLFREKPRQKGTGHKKAIDYETMTIIDPKSPYLPLDNCDEDDY